MERDHVRIAVSDAGKPGSERVPARKVGDNEWQLLRSPLYATEVASGDTVKIVDDERGAFEIVKRGGNVCVQLYLGESEADDADATLALADAIGPDIEAIGGRIDAYTPGLIVFTVPVDAGFPAIEGICAAAVDRSPGGQWQYSNVYDPATGIALGWWKSD